MKDWIVKKIYFLVENYREKEKYKFLQNLNFKEKGKIYHFGKDCEISNPEHIVLGENFFAKSRLRLEAITTFNDQSFSPSIIFGKDIILNDDVHIGCIDRVEIGDNCLLASKIFITDHSHGTTSYEDIQKPPMKRNLVSKGPVIIGKNVWIGEGVVILDGVNIGDNVVIAANTVVNKSFPSNCIIGGVPAKILKSIQK